MNPTIIAKMATIAHRQFKRIYNLGPLVTLFSTGSERVFEINMDIGSADIFTYRMSRSRDGGTRTSLCLS